MRATRREFIKLSAVAEANVPLGERPSFLFTEQTAKAFAHPFSSAAPDLPSLLIRFATRSAVHTIAWFK